MAGVGGVIRAQCGFCLESDSAMKDPKTLHCKHVHCRKCLEACYRRDKKVNCSTFNCEASYASLEQSWSAPEVHTASSRSDLVKPKIYIAALAGKNVDTNDNHLINTKALDQDKSSKASKEEQGSLSDVVDGQEAKKSPCEVHEGEFYALGCEVCHAVACVKCATGMKMCKRGVPHKLVSLDDLVLMLMEPLESKLASKEKELSSLSQNTTKAIRSFQSETENMVRGLHETKTKQIKAIEDKYDSLEAQMMKERAKPLSDMNRFLEDQVSVKHAAISARIQEFKESINQKHQVEIVRSHKMTESAIDEAVEESVPKLQLQNMINLTSIEECRDIELKIISTKDSLIDWEHGLSTLTSTPQSVTLLKLSKVSDACFSVCHDHGDTFVGLGNGSVEKISGEFVLTSLIEQIIDTSSQNQPFIMRYFNEILYLRRVDAITVHKNKIYALMWVRRSIVNVYSLSGDLRHTWDHPDPTDRTNKLAIINDRVVIPDRGKKTLTVYSLTGKVERQLLCSLLSDDIVGMTKACTDSVIVTDYKSSQVARINMKTGKELWVARRVTKPLGVVCYGGRFVMVARERSELIQILDIHTGKFISEIGDGEIGRDGQVVDLHIFGQTLIVPKCGKEKVLFYVIE